MTKELRIKIIKLSLFSIFAGFSSAIVMSIDSIMVNNMLGLSKTGIYSIAFFFGSLLSIPARSINRITSSIVAEAFMNDNIGEIKSLYNKTCNSQFAIGILLFIGIWVNIDNIIHLLPQEYSAGKNVILFVSAGYMIDMATGINQTIIGYSKYYYVEIYFIIITVVLIIISNYILIPIYDITGSAVATAFTITFGNLMRFLFLKIKMKMQPYDMNSVKLIIISVIALLPGYFMPYLNNLIIDIAIRSSIVGGIFILLILKMEATPELNSKIRKNLKRFSINI
jgi:O-antigen/teichoic acid export membrane protein